MASLNQSFYPPFPEVSQNVNKSESWLKPEAAPFPSSAFASQKNSPATFILSDGR